MFENIIAMMLQVTLYANKVCMMCGKVYGTHSGSSDSHGVCDNPKCKKAAREL